MKHNVRPGVLLTVLGIALAGCATLPPTPTPSVTPTATATAAPTLAPSPTPSLTPTLLPTRTPIPTRIPPGEFVYPEDDYLFIEDAECLLPCWHGLRIGESDLAAFHRVAREALGFGSNDVILSEEFIPSKYGLPKEGIQTTGYSLRFSSGGGFWASVVTDEEADLLRAVILDQYEPTGITPFKFHTSQTVLRLLGEPTAIYTEFLEAAPTAPVGGFGRVFIIYEEGMAFFTVHDVSEPLFCLDQPTLSEDIFIMEPFSADLSDLNELQAAILRRALGTDYLPSEVVFGMNPAEITQLAMAEENACLPIR